MPPVTVVALPARGRPPQAAARRAGLEVVEKLLTSITSGSGLAFGQAASRSSWISLCLTADVCDQGLAQLLVRELVAQASDGKPDHVAGRQGQIVKACLCRESAEPSPLLVGQVDGGSVVGACRVLGHQPSSRFELERCRQESRRRYGAMTALLLRSGAYVPSRCGWPKPQ